VKTEEKSDSLRPDSDLIPPSQAGVDIGFVGIYLMSKGLPQKAIAKKLNVDPTVLSRAIKPYKDFLKLELHIPDTLKPVLDWIVANYNPDDPFHARIGRWREGKGHWWQAGQRPKVTILPSEDEKGFYINACERVLHLFDELRGGEGDIAYAGIFYGKTVRELVEVVKKMPTATKGIAQSWAVAGMAGSGGKRKVQFVPLCGDPCYSLSMGTAEYVATELACQLEKELNGTDTRRLPALMGVPAYMPKNKVPEYWKTFRGYVEVFGGVQNDGEEKAGLAEKIELLLTGAGIVDSREGEEDQTGIFIQERVFLGEAEKEEIRRIAYGALMGLLVAKEGHESRVEELNRGWTGLSKARLLAIANRRWVNNPGLVIVARGVDRALMTKAILDQGFPVGELIIDLKLWEELEVLGGALHIPGS
jgi:hypothetical protein